MQPRILSGIIILSLAWKPSPSTDQHVPAVTLKIFFSAFEGYPFPEFKPLLGVGISKIIFYHSKEKKQTTV